MVDVCNEVGAIEPGHEFSHPFLTFSHILLLPVFGGQYDVIANVEFEDFVSGKIGISSLCHFCLQQVVLHFQDILFQSVNQLPCSLFFRHCHHDGCDQRGK